MRIRSFLLLLAAVVLVPGFLASGVAIKQLRDAQREAALRSLKETVRATALLVDGQVQRSLGAMTALGNSANLQSSKLDAFYQEALAIDTRPDVWTVLMNETGKQLINTSVAYGAPLPPSVAQSRVAQVLATQQPLVTDLFIGSTTKKLLTMVYVPAKPTSAGRFVIAQSFSVNHWRKTALDPQGHDGWIVAVIDRKGRFISRSLRSDEMLGQQARPELVAAAAATHDGLIRHTTLEGTDSYDAFTHSDLTGWTIAVAAPVASIEASATQTVFWLATGAAFALGVALLGASILSRMLIRSIATAADTATAIGHGVHATAKQTPVHEVNALNRTLAAVAALLADEKFARENVEAERERLLARERMNRETAQFENAAKDRFLAMLGHELRNPLAAIANATEVLIGGSSADLATTHLHSILQRQTRHLKRIVDDLLEVSRMLSGKIVPELLPLDLSACLRNAIETFKMSMLGGAQQIVVEIDDVWILGDAVRIEQVVSNLLGNAVKFSDPGGLILVTLTRHDRQAVLEISDEGSGIPQELLASIFEPFVQGPPRDGQQSTGLGIGLALVRQLVELQGGQIQALSAGPGQGATFLVTLPCIDAPKVQSVEPVAHASSARAQRVLLVEDNDDTRESTSELLRHLGFEVTPVADGETALRIAHESMPDVVVSDLAMPGITGYELAAAIRNSHTLSHLPLIALTGYGDPRDRVASLAAGFDAHLVKPVDPAALALEIQARIGAVLRPSHH